MTDAVEAIARAFWDKFWAQTWADSAEDDEMDLGHTKAAYREAARAGLDAIASDASSPRRDPRLAGGADLDALVIESGAEKRRPAEPDAELRARVFPEAG